LRRRSGFCPNPSQLLEITLFSTGRDPVSAQLCHDRPRTPAAPIGRECLNSLAFSARHRLGISSFYTRPQWKTAGHRTSPRRTMADQGMPLHSTHREAASACGRWPAPVVTWGKETGP
jgi:hypothetical protein